MHRHRHTHIPTHTIGPYMTSSQPRSTNLYINKTSLYMRTNPCSLHHCVKWFTKGAFGQLFSLLLKYFARNIVSTRHNSFKLRNVHCCKIVDQSDGKPNVYSLNNFRLFFCYSILSFIYSLLSVWTKSVMGANSRDFVSFKRQNSLEKQITFSHIVNIP